MISAWLGRTPPTHFAHALHRETEGNPFFIEEVLRHLIEVAAADTDRVGAPGFVQQARNTRRRAGGDRAAPRQVVGGHAPNRDDGRGDRPIVLDRGARRPCRGVRRAVARALEEAAERRIIEEEAGPPGRYAFAHALIRETLYASLSGPRRVGLHRRIGAILEERHAGDPDPPLGELAYHFVEAAEPGAAAKAVDYSARAGRRALAALAYEEAARHFTLALEALELSESADDATRCDLLLGLGESHSKASEFDRSRSAFETAAELARTAGLAEHLARAALGLGRGWIEQGTADPAIIAVLQEALAALPEPTARSGPGCSAAWPWSFTSPTSRSAAGRWRGRAWSWPGGSVTRRRSRSRSTPGTGPSAARTKSASCSRSPTRSSATLKRPRSSSWPSRATAGASSTSSSSGGRRRSTTRSPRARSLAERLRQPFYRSWVAGLASMRALMQGRFDDAERLAREALAAAESAGNWNGITSSRVQLGWCWKDVGRGAERAAEVERFVQEEVLTRPLSGGAAAVWNGNLALFMAEAGLDARARGYLDRVADCDDTELTRNVDGRSAAALAAEACALLGDERLAPRLYELLLPRDGLCILGGRGVYFRGAAARYLGLLAATLGRWDDAVRHHEHALKTNTRAQAPPWIARSLLDLARALLARGRPGGPAPRDDLLRRAEPWRATWGCARSSASCAPTLRDRRSAPGNAIRDSPIRQARSDRPR